MLNISFAATVSMAITMPVVACDPPIASTNVRLAAPRIAVASAHANAPAMLFTSGAIAMSPDDESESVSEITIHSNDNGNKVEIHIHNDNVTAKVNGKDVPADRIQRDDESITILDENGEIVYSSPLVFFGGGGAHRGFVFNSGDPLVNDPFGGAYSTWLADENVAFKPPKVMLGVHMDSPGPALEKQLKLKPGATTLIAGIYKELPANLAGVQEYDVIVSIDGNEQADPNTIREMLRSKEVGDTIAFGIIQEGQRKDVTVTLEKYDAERMSKATMLGSASNELHIFGESIPGAFTRFRLGEGPSGGTIGVIRPDQWAAADVLRNRAGALRFDNRAMEAQMAELRAQMEAMREMMNQMMPPQPPKAPKAEDAPTQARPLKPNES